MGSPERLITATLNDGTEHTTTYEGWSKITGDLKITIQKRMSARNMQIKSGKQPYTMREVVGLDHLQRWTGRKQIKPDHSELFDSFHRRRLVP